MEKIKDSANKICFIEEQKGNTTENRGNFDFFINFFETNFEYDNEGWAQAPRTKDNLRGWNESRQQELDIYFKESVCNATTIDRVLELLKLVNNRKMLILRVPNDLSTKNEHIQLCDALIAQLEATRQRLARKEQDTPQPKQRKATETPNFKSLLLCGNDGEKERIIGKIREGDTNSGKYAAGVYKVLRDEGLLKDPEKLDRGRTVIWESWHAEFKCKCKIETLIRGANSYLREKGRSAGERNLGDDYTDGIASDLGI